MKMPTFINLDDEEDGDAGVVENAAKKPKTATQSSFPRAKMCMSALLRLLMRLPLSPPGMEPCPKCWNAKRRHPKQAASRCNPSSAKQR